MNEVEPPTRANWLKRCFSIQESQHYLGLKRRAFETHIAPLLTGKGTKVGVTVLFERADLDAAWETYKESARASLPAPAGSKHATTQTRPMKAQLRSSTAANRGETFAEYAARVLPTLKKRQCSTRAGVMVKPLLTIQDIADLLGVGYRHARENLTKRPDFPRPALNLSQMTRRWDRSKVQEWVDTQAKKNAR